MKKQVKGLRALIFFIFALVSIGGPTIGAYLYIWFGDISKPVVESYIDKNLLVILSIFFGYMLALVPIWSYVATWASKIDRKPGVAPISKDELITKLLVLNSSDLPWSIRRGEGVDLVAEWKIVDEKWIDFFAANKMSIVHELRIRLDANGIAHSQDVERAISWRVGVDGRPTASFKISGYKGIDFFQYQWGAAYGVIYKDGELKIDHAYKYRFNLQEMKNPLIEAITENGWSWKGALSISPFWSIIFGG